MLSRTVRSVILHEGRSLDEAIPELTRGTRTPYTQFTSDYKQVSTFDRRDALERRLKSHHDARWDAYLSSSSVWYRLGSGYHWVGAVVFVHSKTREKDGFDQFYVKATLQKSSRGWETAENKVVRWMTRDTSDDEISTGAGSLEFMKWLIGEVKIFASVRRAAAKRGDPSELSIGWADEKRKRAYAWLKRLGFEEGVDSDGDPAYIMLFPSKTQVTAESEPEPEPG